MNAERAAELIAMLCAKTASWELAITQFGALKQADVSLALALVKNLPAQMLVRIKYADEESNVATFADQLASQIERGLLSHVEQFGAPQRWKSPRRDFLRDMCRLALVECLSPNLCWHCGGHTGSLDVEGKWVDCLECAGTGHKRPSERKRARLLQIHESAWKHSWSERYRLIQGEIDKLESIGLGGIAKRLSA